MSLAAELESMLNKAVDERVAQIEAKLIKPWLLMDEVCQRLNKEKRWVTDNFCNDTFKELKLVKKVGRDWHFQNPEFLEYVHGTWWDEQ